MAMASRLFLSSSFLLLQQRTNSRKSIYILSSSSPYSSLRLLHVRSYSAATAADDSATVTATPPIRHPWPEWEHFVDKMNSKGYFARTTTDSNKNIESGAGDEDENGASLGETSVSKDQNRVKNACLKFARERFDILRYLPKEELQTVVECGCPNLFRKAVNSSKRLRAFLKLDESDVCSACVLRESCDKAYVVGNEDEGARTVDVMRILMTYAVDPVLQSGGESPSVKEHVHNSARKLLTELTKLSDTPIDPDLPTPTAQLSSQKKPSQKPQKVTAKHKLSQNVEMKRGDWLCPKCNFLNFARNIRCLECNEDGPKRVDFGNTEMKLGDWTCPQCEFMNYARNKKCFRCKESRPKRQLNPGEWECPSCDFVNFRGNKVCKKCSRDRPEDGMESQFDDHVWKPQRSIKENKALNFGDDDTDDEEDTDEDDILPYHEREKKNVASKRATPAGRRFTSARNRNDSSC